MAAVAKRESAGKDKLYNFAWTGKDKTGKVVRGEVRAGGENLVMAQLRRQGIQVSSVKKVSRKGGKKISPGPFVGRKWPSRKYTPRSYSRSTRSPANK